jgi:hypothetical protein
MADNVLREAYTTFLAHKASSSTPATNSVQPAPFGPYCVKKL